ncbi:CDP-diacylglycerol--glycerol-3-phosphate 3-phosphatidyltransferase [Parvibacter caecicola]|uniref:CDP-diacylglycerol--glycerol-3-phosphate 3-phosphatidyltransferase n=1 Tax=Parvibacter caecicola TaxID=747645 RepID=UPI00249B38F1|nr:CDP-diacylglycerol--glycerol-3-phosphate 3-phosphatidyltransferase [Parvibacter caecicola]
MAGSASEKLWTPSNIITVARICLVPLFVIVLITPWPEWMGLEFITAQQQSLLAAAIFIVISCTDWLDGYLARKRNEVTDFGKFMDPLADKILTTAALLALVELKVLPSWPVLIILTREFIVAGVRMVAASKGVVIAASWYGKAKTVFQIIAIVMFLIKDVMVFPNVADFNYFYVLSWIVMVVALVLTIVSMMDYLVKSRSLLGFSDGAQSAPGPSVAQLQERIREKAAEVVRMASASGVTVATAESCTGGLIAGALTEVPGSSEAVLGGIVSYANSVKEGQLGVSAEALASDGAVSEACALQMCQGARNQLGSSCAVAVTGIAGPGGAVPGKPVGTVWVGYADATGARAQLCHFEGDRQQVRLQTVEFALDCFLRHLSS